MILFYRINKTLTPILIKDFYYVKRTLSCFHPYVTFPSKVTKYIVAIYYYYYFLKQLDTLFRSNSLLQLILLVLQWILY